MGSRVAKTGTSGIEHHRLPIREPVFNYNPSPRGIRYDAVRFTNRMGYPT